jgi:hypothetical protein
LRHAKIDEMKAQRKTGQQGGRQGSFYTQVSTTREFYQITGKCNKSEGRLDEVGRPIWRSPQKEEREGVQELNNEGGVISRNKVYRSRRPKVRARDERARTM